MCKSMLFLWGIILFVVTPVYGSIVDDLAKSAVYIREKKQIIQSMKFGLKTQLLGTNNQN